MTTRQKRGLVCALSIVIAGALVPTRVAAQCPPPFPTCPLAEGEVGLFFDPLGKETCTDVVTGVMFHLYVVARVPEGGVAEFSVPELMSEKLPAGLLIMAPASLPPGSPYDPLIVIDACGQARRPDPMVCPVAQGDLVVLSVTEVWPFAPVTDTACFQTACSTIAGIVAQAPVYYRCDNGAGGAFTGWETMCIGFGQDPSPVESITWGAVKSLYNE